MLPQDTLLDLLLRYEALIEAGQSPTPEEVCKAHPGLLDEFKKRISALKKFNQVILSGPATGSEDPLATFNTNDNRSVRSTASPFPQLPGFTILGELGHGGMGVVYKAQQHHPERLVALKMIRGQPGSHDLARFQIEANAAAQLKHPNIVQIHAVGANDGLPFCCLEYLEGGTLSKKINSTPQPAREAAQIVETLAKAMNAAHAVGVIHRDLKPANVLLTADGTPKISDFGLAKRLEEPGLTMSGIPIGTPSYMAPEQAEGKSKAIGPRTDVYGLGAILYELLTGRPPFRGESQQATIKQVLEREPVPPSRLNPQVPQDLETICLKCLQKNPPRRYQHATELAEDLRRFHAGEPILARRPSPTERAIKWIKRRPVLASLYGVTLVALVSLTALGIGLWITTGQLQDALGVAKNKTTEAIKSAAAAEIAQKQEGAAKRKAQERLVRQYVREGAQLMEEGRFLQALVSFTEALRWNPPEDQGSERLHRLRLALLLSQCPRPVQAFFHSGHIYHAEFSPDGRWLVTAGDRSASADDKARRRLGEARIWDVQTGEPVGAPMFHDDPVVHATFSRDGTLVVTASGDGTGRQGRGAARVWEAQTGAPVTPWILHPGATRDNPGAVDYVIKHVGVITHATFSPDGKLVATASDEKTVRLWNAKTGEAAGGPLAHTTTVAWVEFSPDGKWLATSADGGRVWNVVTGKPLTPFLKSPSLKARFSPDGKKLVTAGFGSNVVLWHPRTGAALKDALVHEGMVRDVAFSPGGQLLATAGEHRVRLWNDYEEKPTLIHHPGVEQVSFRPDGREIVTAGEDVRVWNVATGQQVGPTLTHGGRHAAFDPTGQRLLTWGGDAAWVWELPWDGPFPSSARVADDALSALSPDGLRLATAVGSGKNKGTVRIWNMNTGEALALLPKEKVARLVFSPDGEMLAVADTGNNVQIWNVADGTVILAACQHPDSVEQVLLAKGMLITGCADQKLRWWNIATGQEQRPPLPLAQPIQAVVQSDDGERLVIASGKSNGHEENPAQVQVLETVSGKPHSSILPHIGKITHMELFNSGKRLLTRSISGYGIVHPRFQIWDVVSGKAITSPLACDSRYLPKLNPDGTLLFSDGRFWNTAAGQQLPGALNGPGEFSPGGDRVVTWWSRSFAGNYEGEVRVWKTSTKEPLIPAIKIAGEVQRAAFSPDGRLLVTISARQARHQKKGHVQIWDAVTGEPVSPPWLLPQEATQAQFSPDGQGLSLIAGDWAWRIALAPDKSPLASWQLLGKVLTGQQIDDTGGRMPIPLHPLWQEFAANKRLRDPRPDAAEVRAQHLRDLQLCEADYNPFGTAWHLDRLLSGESRDAILLSRRGQAHLRLNRWEQAAADFSQAIALDGSSDSEWSGRGHAHVGLRQWDKAVADYSSALELGGNPWDLGLKLGAARAMLGQDKQARADYFLIHHGAPDFQFHRRLADEVHFHQSAGNWRALVSLLDELLTEEKRYIPAGGALSVRDAFVLRGIAQLALGKDLPAVLDFDQALRRSAKPFDLWGQVQAQGAKMLESEPKSTPGWLLHGIAQAQQGRWQEAQADLAQSLHLDDQQWLAWLHLGLARLETNQPDQARSAWRKAVASAPPGNGSTTLGTARALLGQLEQAEADFEHGVRRGENHAEAWQSASQRFERWIQLRPGEYQGWAGRGLAHAELGSWKKAADDLIKAADLNSKDAWVWHELGFVQQKLNQHAAAVQSYGKAMDLQPGNWQLWFRRSGAYGVLEKWQEAGADIAQALKLNPKFTRGWYFEGEIFSELRQWDRAIASFSEGIRQNPKSPALVWHRRGLAHAQKKEYPLAAKDLAQALILDREAIPYWQTLAGIQLMQGDLPAYQATCAELLKHFSRREVVGPHTKSKDLLKVSDILTQKDPEDRARGGGFHKVHMVKLSEGASCTIDLVSADFDAFLRLEDAAGKVLAEDDDGGEGTNSRLVFVPPQTGDYRLIATTFKPGATGRYLLTVRATRGPVLSPGQASQLCMTCLLHPDSGAGLESVINLATQAAAEDPKNPVVCRTLGAGLFRAGKFAEARNRLLQADELSKDADPLLGFFMAMTHRQLGKTKEADEWLGAASKETQSLQAVKGGLAPPWSEQAAWIMLRREAKRSLKSK